MIVIGVIFYMPLVTPVRNSQQLLILDVIVNVQKVLRADLESVLKTERSTRRCDCSLTKQINEARPGCKVTGCVQSVAFSLQQVYCSHMIKKKKNKIPCCCREATCDSCFFTHKVNV